jgi:CRP/FNR family transcriptional regulator
MVSLSQKQMPGRVADALIYLSDEIYESSCIGNEISRQDIADYTSMSKDSAIRILKEFERDRIIRLEGRCIEVLDLKRLQSISLMG